MQDFSVLITGSSSGFGQSIAKVLLEKGFTVFATMRGVEGKNVGPATALKEFAADKSGRLHVLDLDVTSDASVQGAVDRALELEGKIDVVINNAGLGSGIGSFTEGCTVEQFEQGFQVNVFGIQRMFRAVLPGMRSRKSGLIVNVSSTMGRVVIPFAGSYTAAKYALEGLTESYRYELAPLGVDVVSVEPGGFATGFWGNMSGPADEAAIAGYGELANVPAQMWGGLGEALSGDDAPQPTVVAEAIAELLAMPAGERPLRTVVDPMTGGGWAKTVNETSSQIQDQLLEAFGIGNLKKISN